MLESNSEGLAKKELGSIYTGKTEKIKETVLKVLVHDEPTWLWEAARDMLVCACMLTCALSL